MGRVFWRSLKEPLGSPGMAATLVGAVVLLWVVAAASAILAAEQAWLLPYYVGSIVHYVTPYLSVPAVLLALPIVSGEAKDRTLLLHLMQPVSRTEYYTGRVLGRAAFALLYFLTASAGLAAIFRVFDLVVFAGKGSPLPPDILVPLLVKALSLVTVVMAVAALAPVSSSRFGHVFYWVGTYLVVQQARDLLSGVEHSQPARAFARLVLEVVQPAMLGPEPRFVEEAALSDWHLARALLQWGFGVALAYLLGVLNFSRMEVGLRT